MDDDEEYSPDVQSNHLSMDNGWSSHGLKLLDYFVKQYVCEYVHVHSTPKGYCYTPKGYCYTPKGYCYTPKGYC